MKIQLNNIGKRYRLEWIFRGMNSTFQSGERWAILGPNGSGKSTLLKVISGHLTPSKGDIFFEDQGAKVKEEAVYQKISYAAPYIELIEEFTLEEALLFHARLKPFLPGFTPASIYELMALPRSRQKEIRFFFLRYETTAQTGTCRLFGYAHPAAGRACYQPGCARRGVVQKPDFGICCGSTGHHCF